MCSFTFGFDWAEAALDSLFKRNDFRSDARQRERIFLLDPLKCINRYFLTSPFVLFIILLCSANLVSLFFQIISTFADNISWSVFGFHVDFPNVLTNHPKTNQLYSAKCTHNTYHACPTGNCITSEIRNHGI